MLESMQVAQHIYNAQQVERIVEVLIEGKRGQLVTGLTPDYQRVKVITDQDLHNTIQNVRLSGLDGVEAFIGELDSWGCVLAWIVWSVNIEKPSCKV